MGLTLAFNTGVIFAEPNTGNTTNQSISYQITSTTAPNNTSNHSDTSLMEGTTSYNVAGPNAEQNYKAAGAAETIKVLIYSGSYASTNCVNGIIRALDYANTNNVIANVVFSYATSTVINSVTLSGFDVLAMPGGSGGYYYLNSGNIVGSAIKSFVANGGGYLGICAGAYSAALHTDGYYDGWGIAPNVRCKAVSYEGPAPVTITSAGQQLLSTSGTVTLAHYNGAAMYVSGNALVFAKYADGSTGYNGYAAIVGDYFGKGRVVLSGPHPELTPTVPTFVSKLIYWAANCGSSSSTLTLNQVAKAASNVKSFYEKNKRLPNYVETSIGQITMPKLLNLLATATIQANIGSTSPITVKDVNGITSPADNYKKGNILKSEFLSIAQSIKTFINNNGRVPGYINTSLGKISYNSILYMYSKILAFYNTNKRLPAFVSI